MMSKDIRLVEHSEISPNLALCHNQEVPRCSRDDVVRVLDDALHRSWFASLLFIILDCFPFTAIAAEIITFKPDFSAKLSWLNYCVAIVMLVIIALIIAKKYKPNLAKKSVCQLVEKKYLSNKTVVYIIEHQQQRFLLADNQHALAIHELHAREPDAPL